jgi:exopolysaccharide biosynthesis polyprenyl glycosylphosphotransferase
MNKNIYKRNLIIPFLKIVIDIITIESAMIFSFWLRFYSPLTLIFPADKGFPAFDNYFNFSIYLIGIYFSLFLILKSYSSRVLLTYAQDIPIILKTSVLAVIFAMSSAFLYRGFSYSRLVFLLIFINSIIFLLVARYVFHQLKKGLIKKGYNIISVGLIGSDERLKNVVNQIRLNKLVNFDIIGYISPARIESISFPYLGSPDQLSNIIHNKKIDGLIIIFNHQEYNKILDVLKNTEGQNIELFYIPDIIDIITSNIRVIESNGILLLQLKTALLSGWQGFIKRVFDISLALFTLIILSPIYLIISILIKITSAGPILYRQSRIGMDKKEFTMIKYRSMYQNAEENTGPVWAEKKDRRVTPIGKILRRTSLDELPQLINVLKGDMSIVGPRPERLHFINQFQTFIPKYLERHRFRSGITGWAQVNGLRGQAPIDERTRYDLFYIENWSLWFDIKIIILTFIAVIKGKNAY